MRHAPFTLTGTTGTIDVLTPLTLWTGSQTIAGKLRIAFTSFTLKVAKYYLKVTTAGNTYYLYFTTNATDLIYDVDTSPMGPDKTITTVALGVCDESGWPWYMGNAMTVSNAQPYDGSYSALCGAANSYMRPFPNLANDTGQYVHSLKAFDWKYRIAVRTTTGAQTFFPIYTGDGGGYVKLWCDAETWRFTAVVNSITVASYAVSQALADNTYYLIEIERAGSTLSLTVNGSPVAWTATYTPIGTNSLDIGGPFEIGMPGESLNYIDYVQLTLNGEVVFTNSFENVSDVAVESLLGLFDSTKPTQYIPITYVEIDLDLCSRTFGSSPCLATGTKCYNTFGTCKYISAFSKGTAKTLKFCGNDAPLPFMTGERPYIKAVKYLPTEIKSDLAVTGRVNIQMYDEPDGDIGVDPYVSSRTRPVPGNFWTKLLARNPNYKNRRIRIYEGYLGESYATITGTRLVFDGLLDSIRINNGGVATIEAVDKLAKLKDIELPAKTALSLGGAAAVDAANLYVSGDLTVLPATGYVLIDENIIKYSSIVGNTLLGCLWGQFGTAKTAIADGASVQLVKYYSKDNPFDHIIAIIQDAGFTVAADVDQDSFAEFASAVAPVGDIAVANKLGWRDWPEVEPDISAVITAPVKLSDLLAEICDTIGARVWVNEDSKIQITKALPNKPGRSYTAISDAYNIMLKSDSLDIAEDQRLTRARVYWGKYPLGDVEDPENYRYAEMVVDADAESANLYADAVMTKTAYCRWINTDCAPALSTDTAADMRRIAKIIALRWVARHRVAPKYLEVTMALKDQAIHTGQFVQVTTDSIVDRFGTGLSAWPFMVIKRERAGKQEIKYTLEMLPGRRMAIIGGASMTDYASATAAEREYGYIGNASNLMSNDDDGYYIF